jgi:hypothetical protein
MCLAVISGGVSSLASQRESRVHPIAALPVWKLDLKALGYKPPTFRELAPGQLPRPLCFLSEGEVAVTFVDRITGSLPRRGESTPSLPLRLHALFIDGATAQLRATQEWPTGSYQSEVIPGREGRFAVITPDRLLLYSPHLEILKQLNLTLSCYAAKGTTRFYASPGGKYLLISYEPRAEEQTWNAIRPSAGENRKQFGERIARFAATTSTVEVECIDLDSLRVSRSWTQKGLAAGWEPKITDTGTMLVVGGRQDIETLTQRGVRYVICPSINWGCSISATFVSNDALFSPWVNLGTGRVAIRLTRTDGKLVFEQKLPEKQYVRHTAASASRQRFAVAIDRGRGGSELLDIGAHYSLDRIMVYDIPSRQWIYILDVEREGIKSISGLALSPYGTLMALINQDGILEMFRLPPAGSVSPAGFASQPGPR